MPNTSTPVALCIFNRPRETAATFAAIRAARPSRLFVIADGPRNERDEPLCAAARAAIQVDWPCEVRTNYADTNMGCKERMISGITWVFDQVDEAIIMEDDCVADPSFFPFCTELLTRYENDERVMAIYGTSFQEKNPKFTSSDSYYFSMLPMGWGAWATWRRAWRLYDREMGAWPRLRASGALVKAFPSRGVYERFEHVWNQYYAGELPTSWDGMWVFACVANGGLCINPSLNLVENIGFNAQATHHKTAEIGINLPARSLPFPLRHPTEIAPHRVADTFMFREYFGIDKKLRHRLLRPIKERLPFVYTLLKRLRARSS